jgi:hypothetical protein
MILVPLFDLRFLIEFAAGVAGTSNRRHYGGFARFLGAEPALAK